MKKITLLFLLLITKTTFAQGKIIAATGIINFEASVPLFEEIKATNETVSCVLNIKTGEISSVVVMKEFHFKLSLMEEHFNEKYIESDRYPKASFKGIIEGFNWNIIGNSTKEFKMKGNLEIHGKSKEITTLVFLKKVNNGLEVISDFKVNIKDFSIEIPEILSMKVAEKVNIKTLFLFK
jgi:hypothetical protein